DALGDGGCAGGETQGIADRYDGVADHRLGRVPEGDGGQVGPVVDLEQRNVLGLVVADERGGQRLGLAVLGHRDGAGVATLAVELDDVVVRDDLTIGSDDHAGPLVLGPVRLHVDGDDRRDHPV